MAAIILLSKRFYLIEQPCWIQRIDSLWNQTKVYVINVILREEDLRDEENSEPERPRLLSNPFLEQRFCPNNTSKPELPDCVVSLYYLSQQYVFDK